MEFLIAKILGPLAMPSRLIVLALLLGLLLRAAFRRRPIGRLGGGMAGISALALATIAVVPLGDLLLHPLERRFPPPGADVSPAGVVVLGGAIDAPESARQGRPAVNAAAERLFALAALARDYPDAMLVFTGGTGSLRRPEAREAAFARTLIAGIGVDPERILWDAEARTTRENAVAALALADPAPGETWLLVTSAWHMPRAVGSFRAVGFDVVAYPVDFRAGDGVRWGFDPAANLVGLDRAAHEWLGLAWYRIQGWTDRLVPAADPPR